MNCDREMYFKLMQEYIQKYKFTFEISDAEAELSNLDIVRMNYNRELHHMADAIGDFNKGKELLLEHNSLKGTTSYSAEYFILVTMEQMKALIDAILAARAEAKYGA